MKDFLERSRKYTESFVLSGKSNQKLVLKEWWKISWCLFRSEDAKGLENRLQSHVNAFQIFLTAIFLGSQSRTQGATNEILEICRRVERMQCESQKLASATESQLPKALGYSWNGSLNPKHGVVNFENVLGMHVELPVILCRDFEIFHDVLEIMFRNLPGHKSVIQREYEIGDSNGNMIRKSEWERKILLQGIYLVMTIIFRKSLRLPNFLKPADIPVKCPRCTAHTSGGTEGFVSCAVCGLIFQVTDSTPVVEKSPPKVIDLTWRISNGTTLNESLWAPPARPINFDTSDNTIRECVHAFKRIHCIRSLRFLEPALQRTMYKHEIFGRSRIAGKIRRFLENRFPGDMDIVGTELLKMSDSDICYTVHAPIKLTTDFRVVPALVGEIIFTSRAIEAKTNTGFMRVGC
ncbi:hypothetical protein BDD12DRAFT_856713, partial [Trichophaea hybrida]